MENEIELAKGDLLVQKEPSDTGLIVDITPRTVKVMWRAETKKYKKSECIDNINQGIWMYVAKLKRFKNPV